MTSRRRHPRDGARTAAALLLSGAVLLGAGAGLALGDDPRIAAEDLGTVPASAPDRAGPVPASEVLPVLAPPGRVLGAPDAAAPADRTLPLPGPGVPAGEVPRPAGPAPLAPQQPWTVSPIYPPAGPVPAAPPAPVVPATLELPARGITAPVEAVGTGPNGGMVIPEQVRTVGWWAPGVLPGGAVGSSVIAGHVDSRTQGLGVLAVLPRLTAGEPVVVRGADGRTATYRVAARREYGKHDLPRDVFRRDGSPQLVLITCGGVFDPATGSYESNIVVYAVPAPL